MYEAIASGFSDEIGNVIEIITKTYSELSPDESAAISWLAFFAVPTWMHALKNSHPPEWFWSFTAIGLAHQSYEHLQGAFDYTSVMFAVDGAGAAVAAARGWKARFSEKV